jgi:hypothetical protein
MGVVPLRTFDIESSGEVKDWSRRESEKAREMINCETREKDGGQTGRRSSSRRIIFDDSTTAAARVQISIVLQRTLWWGGTTL